MADNPLTPNEIRFQRDRILTEISRAKTERSSVPPPEQVESLFNRAAFISNKANVLSSAIAERAREYFIPVHPQATEVRAAVSRKSDDGTDDRISFDLFKDAVEAMQRFRKEMEPLVKLGPQIEPDSVLSKKIRKLRSKVNLDLSDSQEDDNLLEMLVSQFIILYLAHELMKPFEGILDHLPLSDTLVAKSEGSPETQIMISVLIGLAIQLIIMGLNDDLMETYLEKSGLVNLPFGITARDIIAQARNIEQTKSMELARLHKAQNDYELILNYCMRYIQNNLDSGYELWIAYVDTVQMRYVAQSMWAHAPHYSVPHALSTQKFNNSRKRKSKQEGDLVEERRSLELKQAVLEGLVPMSLPHYVARADALDGIDDNLNTIAQVLSSDFAMGVACCLGATLGEIPTKVLKAIKALLEGLLRSYAFDLNNVIAAIFSHLTSPSFEEILALEASHQIDKIFDKIVSKVLGMFGEEWEALLCCPLLGEMISVILQTITRIEAELKGAIQIFSGKLINSLGIGELRIKGRYEHIYDTRIIRKMIMILDAVIKFSESMDMCNKEWLGEPYPDAIRGAIALPTIRIEERERKNYFTTAVAKELDTGKLLPALGEDITSLIVDSIQESIDEVKGKHVCGEVNTDALLRAVSSFLS